MLWYHPFAIGGLAYVIVVVGAAVFGWSDAAPSRDYTATHDLPPNHRLVAGDFRRAGSIVTRLGFYLASPESLEGHYVTCLVLRGQAIRASALAEKPDLQGPSNMVDIVFPLASDSHMQGLLDVGSAVLLIGQGSDGKPISAAATVQAIVCDPTSSNTQTCYPVLGIKLDQSDLVIKNLGALRLTLGPAPANAKVPK